MLRFLVLFLVSTNAFSAVQDFIWDAADPADNVTKYTIYCSPPGIGYGIGIDSTTNTIPVNRVISSDGTYLCMVTATNSFGESPPSNEINIEVINGQAFYFGTPPAPTGLRLQ